ncbi:hypothetical protein Acr_00g0070500 [Actinidia rufa]|uniref:Uncharacterized protein n=1 Tax=Actinidia rufa TaxID=165716 RepID=A0A7J0DR93_9ERIC|nr:hypothetical protein Acr_00g0070500 [Actinidia rufa]
MSRNSGVTRSGDLDSLPSWISDHLGEGSSFMTDEVNQSPASPMEGSLPLETNPLAAIHPSVEEKTNIMTLEELDALREAYSFPSRVQVRLPEEGETITSACPGEVFKYTLSFSEFRNLFSLNSNPKSDQGWLYFKARNKKTLLEGYPNNVKGWKSKFFFISGDEWELLEGSPREGTPRVPKTWGFQHCNNPSRLYGDEPKVFEEIFKLVEKIGRFSVPVLLELKSFRRVFVSPGSMASGIAGESRPSGEAPSSSGDVGESQNSHEHARRQSPSRDDSVEYLGSIMIELRRILPHIPDLTLLRVVIGDKCTGESLASSASKKGKVNDGSKGKEIDREPEGKKKAISLSNALTVPATASSRLGEGTSATLSAALGPTAFILGSPFVAEKLLRGVIPLADKEKSREAEEQASFQEGRVASMETEVARLQKLSADLEQQLAEARVREQQANDELSKTKSDRDSLADKVERSGVLVVKLREALGKTKESAVEEFKSSSKFVVAVEDSTSKYFGKGFDFYKVQLRRHHPDLAIDLEGTMVDQDLLAEQVEAAEEREKEKAGENEGAIIILATKTYKAK